MSHSYLPWFEAFYKLLNNLADYVTKGQVNTAFPHLSVSLLNELKKKKSI